VGRDESVLTKGDVDVSERVAQLHEAHGLATKRADKDFIASRIASLTGGVGVIEVGGHTDLEQKELCPPRRRRHPVQRKSLVSRP